NTVSPPTIIPNNAPLTVVFFQTRERIINGPKAAPNPAQALPTRPKILSLGFNDKTKDKIATINTDIRLMRSMALGVAYFLKKVLKISSVIELEVTNN